MSDFSDDIAEFTNRFECDLRQLIDSYTGRDAHAQSKADAAYWKQRFVGVESALTALEQQHQKMTGEIERLLAIEAESKRLRDALWSIHSLTKDIDWNDCLACADVAQLAEAALWKGEKQ